MEKEKIEEIIADVIQNWVDSVSSNDSDYTPVEVRNLIRNIRRDLIKEINKLNNN